MKTIDFKVVKLGEKEPDLNIPIEDVLKIKDLDALKEQCAKVMKDAKEVVFDWKIQLKNHINSPKWQRLHLLTDGDSIQQLLALTEIFNSKNGSITVDKETAHLICDIADSCEWPQVAHKKYLEVRIEFKKYFVDLRAAKDEPMKKSKKKKNNVI